MKFRFMESHQGQFSVRRMCQVLGVSSSGFYAKRAVSQRGRSNSGETSSASAVHEYTRITAIHGIRARRKQATGDVGLMPTNFRVAADDGLQQFGGSWAGQ